MSLSSTKPLNPGRNQPCSCGSGLRFEVCCGALEVNRPPPHGISVHRNFLNQDECKALVERLNTMDSERLKTIDSANTTRDAVVLKLDEARVTERVAVGEEQTVLNDLLHRAITAHIEPETDRKIEWFEQPRVLKYCPGGFYAQHADSENYDALENRWVRVADRDISVLLYLNDEFEGGEILFDKFHYRLKPSAGMLVFFPPDHRYAHTAQAVRSGSRYAIVSFMSAVGVPKLRTATEHAIKIS